MPKPRTTGKPIETTLQSAERHDQQGALCWRVNRGRVQVSLITSRDTGRWIIPKGWPANGKSMAQSAAQESWEEAGVEGNLSNAALGSYRYDKLRLNKPALPCTVSIFGIRVNRLASKFPERHQRRRKWFSAAKAAKKVIELELRNLLQQLAKDPKTVLSDRALSQHSQNSQKDRTSLDRLIHA